MMRLERLPCRRLREIAPSCCDGGIRLRVVHSISPGGRSNLFVETVSQEPPPSGCRHLPPQAEEGFQIFRSLHFLTRKRRNGPRLQLFYFLPTSGERAQIAARCISFPREAGKVSKADRGATPGIASHVQALVGRLGRRHRARAQRATRVPLLGQVFEPAIEERRHAHALLEQGLRRRQRTEDAPKVTDRAHNALLRRRGRRDTCAARPMAPDRHCRDRACSSSVSAPAYTDGVR